MVVKDTLYFLPSLSHLNLEQEQNFWTTTNDIGRVEDVDISVNGFDYTESPLGEFRANFVVKDVTGLSFTVDVLRKIMKEQFGHLIVELKFLRFLLRTKFVLIVRAILLRNKTRGVSSQS